MVYYFFSSESLSLFVPETCVAMRHARLASPAVGTVQVAVQSEPYGESTPLVHRRPMRRPAAARSDRCHRFLAELAHLVQDAAAHLFLVAMLVACFEALFFFNYATPAERATIVSIARQAIVGDGAMANEVTAHYFGLRDGLRVERRRRVVALRLRPAAADGAQPEERRADGAGLRPLRNLVAASSSLPPRRCLDRRRSRILARPRSGDLRPRRGLGADLGARGLGAATSDLGVGLGSEPGARDLRPRLFAVFF